MAADKITYYEMVREINGSPEWEIFMHVVSDARRLLDIIRPDEVFVQPVGDILAKARLTKVDDEVPSYTDVIKELRGYVQAGHSPEYIGGILQELEEGHLALERMMPKNHKNIPRIII
jgi:hypothetical protein